MPLCFPLVSFVWGWTLASKWGLRRNSATSGLPDLGFSIFLCSIHSATLQKDSQTSSPRGWDPGCSGAPHLFTFFGRRFLGFEELG